MPTFMPTRAPAGPAARSALVPILVTGAGGIALSVIAGIAGYWLGSSAPPATVSAQPPADAERMPEKVADPGPAAAAMPEAAPPAVREPPPPAAEEPREEAPERPAEPVHLATLRDEPEPGRPLLAKSLTLTLQNALESDLEGAASVAAKRMVERLRRSDLEPAGVQLEAVKVAVKQLKPTDKQQEVPASLVTLAERLDTHASKLEAWIKTSGKGGRTLVLPGSTATASKEGYAGVAWGVLPGWGPDVSDIDLGSGRVYRRVSISGLDPSLLRTQLVGQPPESQPSMILPPLERIPLEHLSVFQRDVPGTADKAGSIETLMVVAGELVAASRRLTPPDTENTDAQYAIIVAASSAAGKALVARLGPPDMLSLQLPTHFERWSSDQADVVVLCVDKLPPAVGELVGDAYLQSATARGGGWKVLPGAVFSTPWTSQFRGALGAMSEKAREIIAPLPATGKDRLVLVSVGVETNEGMPMIPGGDGPVIQLAEPAGRRFDDLGPDMAALGMMTMTNMMGGSDSDVRGPLDPTKYRAFMVPLEVRGLEVVVKGSKRGVALPDPVDATGIDQQRVPAWVEVPWSELPAEEAAKIERQVISEMAFTRDLHARIDRLPKPPAEGADE